MVDPVNALNEWWSLIKPGGYLVLVVPDEDLYEQGTWPSRFNADHKHTFRLNKNESWSPVSFDVLKLVNELPGVKVISAEIQDADYNHQLKASFPITLKAITPAFSLIGKIIHKFLTLVKPCTINSKIFDFNFMAYL